MNTKQSASYVIRFHNSTIEVNFVIRCLGLCLRRRRITLKLLQNKFQIQVKKKIVCIISVILKLE